MADGHTMVTITYPEMVPSRVPPVIAWCYDLTELYLRSAVWSGGEEWIVATRSEVEAALRHLAPRLPAHEFGSIADHAVDSPGLRAASPEAAAWLSLVAYARHVLTEYDELLKQGYDRDSARFFVAEELQAILESWGVRRRLDDSD